MSSPQRPVDKQQEAVGLQSVRSETKRTEQVQTVIVTGGERGIGRSCVERFGRAGFQLAVLGAETGAMEELSHMCKLSGWPFYGTVGDVSDAASVSRFVDETQGKFGGVNCLVNNAAIASTGTVETVSEVEWDRVVDVNLKGPYLMSRQVIPLMRKVGGGAIVHMSSFHAFATASGRGVYTATKAGLLGLTRVMALDHGRDKIRVNAVCPGTIETGMLQTAWPKLRPDVSPEQALADLAEIQPLGELGQPEDVAEAVFFLCSEAARYITGAEIKVDGGILGQLATAPAYDTKPE